jgi:hypothetical protein
VAAIREAGDLSPIILVPETRTTINSVLRHKALAGDKATEAQELHGVLRALHLDKDWLVLSTDGGPVQINGLAEAVDDVIGPMVNRKVVVQVQRHGRRLNFLDIEIEE